MTLDKKWQYLFSQSDCPPMEDLMRYARGTITTEDKRRIENHLTGCSMCSDVVEGYLVLGDDDKLLDAANEIAARLDAELFHSRKRKLTWFSVRKIAVAASILVITSLSLLYIFTRSNTQDQLAQNNSKEAGQANKTDDTILITRNKPQQQPLNFATGQKALLKNQATTDKNLSAPIKVSKNETEPVFMEEAGHEAVAKTAEKAAPMSAVSRLLQMKTNKTKIPLNNGKFLVSGKVTDASTGEGLPGVNVVVKGTTQGGVTDNEGKFHIETPDTQTVLLLSFIGFETAEITVNPNQEASIAMVEDVKRLEEVVVIGYGTQKKSDVTGSVTTISMEQEYKNNGTERIKNEIETVKQQLLANPNDRNLWLSLSKKYLEISDIKALEALNKLKDLSNSSIQAQIDEVIQLIKLQKFFKARHKLRKIK